MVSANKVIEEMNDDARPGLEHARQDRRGRAVAAADEEAIAPAGSERPASPPWLGKRVGHFKLIGLLGQGAMGRVFRVEDTLLRRFVALKVLPKSIKRGEKVVAIERLIHEAQAVATLDHPNVVTVYEVNESGGVYYIAMELAEGGSLRELVKAAGPLEYTRACLLCADAADALAHAHMLGIVHRDVKPANLMLTRTGRCKVTDFGLARGVENSDLSKPIPEAVGTPQFIAPELLRGDAATAQSDVYSLAATLWYLLTGRAIFDATSTPDLLQKHLDAPVPDITLLRPDVPATLGKAIMKALAKQPEDRFDSIAQFAKVLRVHTIPVESGGSSSSVIAAGVGPEDTAYMSLASLRPRRTSPRAWKLVRRLPIGKILVLGSGWAAAAALAVLMLPTWKVMLIQRMGGIDPTSAANAPAATTPVPWVRPSNVSLTLPELAPRTALPTQLPPTAPIQLGTDGQ
jgi:serine/threonine-protein kinase